MFSNTATQDSSLEESDLDKKISLKSSKWKDLFNSSLVASALVLLIIVFSLASPYFLSSNNAYHIIQQVAVVAVLAVGQTYVIITAGIDLSQGAVVGLSGVVGALLMQHNSIEVAIAAGLAVGLVVGALNGFLITIAKLPPFIATLATLSIGGGVALILTNGQPVFNIPSSFVNFGSGGIGIFPYIAIVMLALAVLFQVVLSYTRFGRFTYAVGSNIVAARLSGLKVGRQLFFVYLISGFMSAVGGLLLTGYVASALPSAGSNYELESIAAVVIGGGSLFGGEGTVWGSIVGALLLATLSNGTQLLGISTYVQVILLGLVVILAVYFDNFRRRKGV